MISFLKKHRLLLLVLLGCAVLTALYFLVFAKVSAQDIYALLAKYDKAAPWLYILLFTLLPAFFFPVAVIALAGGLLFGLWWGSVYTFIGAILNCTLMFLMAKHFGRRSIDRYVQEKLSPQWRSRLQRAAGKEGFLLLIILRLIPAMPYNLINYGFGLSQMSWGAYIVGSALGIIPGTLVFINIGDKAMDPSSPSFWIAMGLLVLLLIVTSLMGKKLFPENKKDKVME